MKDHELDALIDQVTLTDRRKTCKVCETDGLSKAINRWLERRASGESLPALQPMHEQFFSTIGDVGISTVRRHVQLCLGLDHKTGKPLNG